MDVIVTHPVESVNDETLKFLADFLKLKGDAAHDPDIIIAKLLELLRLFDFTGSDHAIRTAHGFFFPQTTIEMEGDEPLSVGVAGKLEYAQWGAPGLAIKGSGQRRSYVPGVFTGKKLGVTRQTIYL